MSGTTSAFARIKIDALLKGAGWNLTDGSNELFEHALPDGTQADYGPMPPPRSRRTTSPGLRFRSRRKTIPMNGLFS